MPGGDRKNLPDRAPSDGDKNAEIDDFLRRVQATPRPSATGRKGRLLFAMDATASRRPTWDTAIDLQSEMFFATRELGGLEVQLAYYRGFAEFKCSPWLKAPGDLARLMSSVACLAGRTQLEKVLLHARNLARDARLSALVFVGDCLEEDVDRLGHIAGELNLLGAPAFLFHEGDDPIAAFGFAQIARLSGGAHCRFDASSPQRLKELLAAVAVYAAGGRKALENHARKAGGEARALTRRMGREGSR